MAANTHEARQKLRAYLWQQKKKGALNDPQATALEALNEIDQLVSILKTLERTGLTPDLQLQIHEMVKRNSPG